MRSEDYQPDPFCGNVVHIKSQYLIRPYDVHKDLKDKSFLIAYRDWRMASYVEKHMCVQRLIHRLLTEGWLRRTYLHEDLLDDLKYLHRFKGCEHIRLNNLSVPGWYGTSVQRPGMKLVAHFTDWAFSGDFPISKRWTIPRLLNRKIWQLLKKKHDVTRNSVIHIIKRNLQTYKNKILNPNLYRTIIRHFGLNGLVIADPNPGFAWKAIACVLEECPYFGQNNFSELAEFLGCEFSVLDDRSYDCVFLDNNFDRVDPRPSLDLWQDKADMKIVFVPVEYQKQMPQPDKYIRIRTTVERSQDMVFLYA